MCGEKRFRGAGIQLQQGSPPHVRGKVYGSDDAAGSPGITPACAGKRGNHEQSHVGQKDHPRMCGEKTKKIP